jgi:acyl carrier protein
MITKQLMFPFAAVLTVAEACTPKVQVAQETPASTSTNWSKKQLLKKTRLIISQQSGVPVKKLSLKLHLVNDLGLDSLDAVEIIMDIEEAFAIRIPDEMAEKLVRVGEIEEYLIERLRN